MNAIGNFLHGSMEVDYGNGVSELDYENGQLFPNWIWAVEKWLMG